MLANCTRKIHVYYADKNIRTATTYDIPAERKSKRKKNVNRFAGMRGVL